MNPHRILLVLAIALIAELFLSTSGGLPAFQNPTTNPTVEAMVASTLTALAPTFEALQPTTVPTATPSRTPLPTRTPTRTRTPTPTLSIEEQVARTITAIYVDETTLKVWVGRQNAPTVRHDWYDVLPDVMKASSYATADLVVTIGEITRSAGSEQYTGCGSLLGTTTVHGFIYVYVADLFDKDQHRIATRNFEGSRPDFPFSISSCADRYGSLPSSAHFVSWLRLYTDLG